MKKATKIVERKHVSSLGLGHLQHSKPSEVRGLCDPETLGEEGEGERGRAPQAGAQSSPRIFCSLRSLLSSLVDSASSAWPEVLSVEQSKHVLYILKASFSRREKDGDSPRRRWKEGARASCGFL